MCSGIFPNNLASAEGEVEVEWSMTLLQFIQKFHDVIKESRNVRTLPWEAAPGYQFCRTIQTLTRQSSPASQRL